MKNLSLMALLVSSSLSFGMESDVVQSPKAMNHSNSTLYKADVTRINPHLDQEVATVKQHLNALQERDPDRYEELNGDIKAAKAYLKKLRALVRDQKEQHATEDSFVISLQKVRRSADKKACTEYQTACQGRLPLPEKGGDVIMSSGDFYLVGNQPGDRRGFVSAISDPEGKLYSIMRRLTPEQIEKLMTGRNLTIDGSIRNFMIWNEPRKAGFRRLIRRREEGGERAPRQSHASTLTLGDDDWSLGSWPSTNSASSVGSDGSGSLPGYAPSESSEASGGVVKVPRRRNKKKSAARLAAARPDDIDVEGDLVNADEAKGNVSAVPADSAGSSWSGAFWSIFSPGK